MSVNDGVDSKMLEPGMLVVRGLIKANFGESIPSEDDIRSVAKPAKMALQCSDETLEAIINNILSSMGHRMNVGSMISAEHKSWYLSRTKDLEMRFTNRNLKYLDSYRHLSPGVIRSLDRVTSDIMDGLGDPESGPFNRRGLVMGDVQSGKTNTYTTLCCKAADVGYKVIILLTGTLEILRKQTQSRLDDGLVGSDSARMIKKQPLMPIGVGMVDPSPKMFVFTTTENDFRSSTATSLSIPVQDLSIPLLLVLKKNKKVLSNLCSWLKTNTNGCIQSPLLLIDDEADNASVNTSAEEVTAINQSIRDILGLFQSTTYVGFTATPYANIFIDPDVDEDLYPRDFIYCLRSPDNYIGPQSMYSDKGQYHSAIKTIPVVTILDKDKKMEGLLELPFGHDKDFVIRSMPPTLEEAICCFVISCAIRDLRGQETSHMSMMINMSRFTAVQETIKELVYEYVYRMKTSIEVNAGFPVDIALDDSYIAQLHETWSDNYADSIPEFGWEQIQRQLIKSSKPIDVRSVNQNNGPRNLNYADCPDGLRVIAIGGNSLSRGLTLEGLCISYFYRRSQSYDTLMQMGRWFGYRDGYADLCRVWMTEESINWYRGISEATEELKSDFQFMYDLKRTPKDFGLRVKNNITGLLITSRNKMRTADDEVIIKSLEGTPIWTSSIYCDIEFVKRNNILVSEFIKGIDKTIPRYYNELTKNWVWRRVQTSDIIAFLRKYEYPEKENVIFDADAVIETLSSSKFQEKWGYWDVAIQHGIGEEYRELGLSFGNNYPRKTTRSNFTKSKDDDRVIRFNSAALMSPTNMKEGIYKMDGGVEVPDPDRISTLEKAYKESVKGEREKAGKDIDNMSYPPKAYLRDEKRRPLLLIYPVQARPSKESKPDVTVVANELGGYPAIGIAMGFPEDPSHPFDDSLSIRYKANLVYQRLGSELHYDWDSEDDDE